MRELRVVGLNSDAKHVICEDAATSEKFTIPVDERLLAAARGDLSRLGQIQLDAEPQLRPREIQSRIRAGATVAEVAAAAGVSESRVERFAHPVLLERSRAAELAGKAHVVRSDGPSLESLSEIVDGALRARGFDPADAEWDSFRAADGRWVVTITFRRGSDSHTARWRFTPGAHGGVVDPVDDLSWDIQNLDLDKPFTTIAPVARMRAVPTRVEPDAAEREARRSAGRHLLSPPAEEVTFDADALTSAQRAGRMRGPRPVEPVVRPEPEDVVEDDPVSRAGAGSPTESEAGSPTEAVSAPDETVPDVETEPGELREDEPEDAASSDEAPTVDDPDEPDDEPSPDPAPNRAARRAAARNKTNAGKGRGKPAMPSWEDVLLGVRSGGDQ